MCLDRKRDLRALNNICYLVLIVKERKPGAHARITYKERSLIFRIYILIIVSCILFVFFISKGYYSSLNN